MLFSSFSFDVVAIAVAVVDVVAAVDVVPAVAVVVAAVFVCSFLVVWKEAALMLLPPTGVVWRSVKWPRRKVELPPSH